MTQLKKKGPGNPGTPQVLVEQIWQIVETDPRLSNRQVSDEVRRILEQWKSKDGKVEIDGKRRMVVQWLPVERTIDRIRKRLGPPLTSTLDDPWSLATSSEEHIPDEANKDLLLIWRWCLVVGRGFTRREAKWVSRLRAIVPFKHLLWVASNYARRERIADRVKQETQGGEKRWVTTGLDSTLAFEGTETNEWQYITLAQLRYIPNPRPLLEAQMDELKSTILERMDLGPGWVIESYLHLRGLMPRRDPLPPQAEAVYAIWLRKASEAPLWETLTTEKRLEIAKRLYEESAKVNETVTSWHRQATARGLPGIALSKEAHHEFVEPFQSILSHFGLGE